MRQRMEQIFQIYKGGLKTDWMVFGADAVGIAIVVFAFVNARTNAAILETSTQIASVSGY